MSKAHGSHVMVDYTDFFPNTPELGKTMLKLMESTIDNSTAKGFIHTLKFLMALLPLQALLLLCYLMRVTFQPIAILIKAG